MQKEMSEIEMTPQHLWRKHYVVTMVVGAFTKENNQTRGGGENLVDMDEMQPCQLPSDFPEKVVDPISRR